MTNYTILETPGTPLSDTALAVATARRGFDMCWSGSSVVREFDHGLGAVFGGNIDVKTIRPDVAARAQAYVRFTADLPTIKQFRVPLSLRERSP